MGQKEAGEVDVVVGARIKAARVSSGMSQEALAEAIGVTFQQVQKYEKGANRITVSRLLRVADALGTDAAKMLEGLGGSDRAPTAPPPPLDAASSKVARDFGAIADRRVRRSVAALVAAVSGG